MPICQMPRKPNVFVLKTHSGSVAKLASIGMIAL